MGRTPRGETRAKILEYMRQRILRGDPPTVREVQRAFGFRAVESARAHLHALVREGHLVQRPGLSRGYRLPGAWGRNAMVPLLGQIQAGGLSEAIEDPEGYLSVQHSFSPEELFALRVRGRSMIGVGILPDDLVIVRRQTTAHAGEVVVALVGDEATVKTLHFRGGRAILRPENPEFEPIEPELDELKILGRVIEVRRFLDKGPERNKRVRSRPDLGQIRPIRLSATGGVVAAYGEDCTIEASVEDGLKMGCEVARLFLSGP